MRYDPIAQVTTDRNKEAKRAYFDEKSVELRQIAAD
jgi:hypothetical protein